MRHYLKVEMKHLLTNKKNWAVWIILLVCGIYYAQVDVVNFLPTEHLDERVLRAEYNEKNEFLERVTLDENSHYSTVYYAQTYPQWRDLLEGRLDAIATKNYHTYADYSSRYYEYADEVISASPVPDLYYNLAYYKNRNAYAALDGHFGYRKTAQLYASYASLKVPLTKEAINEKTALQSLYRASLSVLPVLLLFSVLFINVDNYFLDKKHLSLTSYYPLTSFKRIITKLLIGSISGVVSLGMFLPSFILVGLRYGFGSLQYPVSIFKNNFINEGEFTSVTLTNYFLNYLVLLGAWVLIIATAILVLNHVLKRVSVSVLLLSSLLTVDFLFARRGIGIRNIFVYLPTSYLKIGEVITGQRSHFYGNQWLNQTSGLIVLFSYFILLFILILLIVKLKKE